MILKQLTYLLIFFYLLSPKIGHSFSNKAYQFPKELKRVFWKRYFNWLHTNFKSHTDLIKVENISKYLESDKNLGFGFIYEAPNLVQVPKIILVSSKKAKTDKECRFWLHNPKSLSLSCKGDNKTWQKSICSQFLKTKSENVKIFDEDKCFENDESIIVLSDAYRPMYYENTWKKVFSTIANEFTYYPGGLIFNKKLKTMSLLYY